MLRRTGCAALLVVIAWPLAAQAQGIRVKDITQVAGERANQLRGLGLVIGLDGTGGRSLATQQMAVDMLQKLNVTAKIVTEAKTDNVFKSTNVAMVMVTAELPPFARRGTTIDVTVSSLDAQSLQGGTLLPTPIDGLDGNTYAIAQGSLTIGGFGVQGDAAKAQKNQLNVGRVPDGATVEREALGEFHTNGIVRLLLRSPDHATAHAITKAINGRYPKAALTKDSGTVQMCIPPDRTSDAVGFVGEVGLLEVSPDVPARVVINERTGTIVAGEHVKIATVAVSHGSLHMTTTETPQVSQPLPFSNGETVVVPRTTVDAEEEGGKMQVVERTATVADVARGLNALGATPRDLISIFQNLKQAGALHAELVMLK